MPTSDTPIRRITPDDVPFAPDFADAALDELLEHSIFDRLGPEVPQFETASKDTSDAFSDS